jgi:hypothetical protein
LSGSEEPSHRHVARLGARLADAEGFRVVGLDGRNVGLVEHVRYMRHADHPDEIVVTRRILFWRRQIVIPFEAVGNVDPVGERVYLTIPAEAINRMATEGDG